MKKLILFWLILSMSSQAFNQECVYMGFGYGFETFQKAGAMGTILTDFNNLMNTSFTNVSSTFEFPGVTRGLVLTGRAESEYGGVGVSLIGHKFRTEAQGADALNNPFFRRLKVSHSGFSIIYAGYLVRSEGFRMGPGFGLNFEQFRCRVEYSEKVFLSPGDMVIDKFYMSASLRFPIVMGGEDFAIEIIPYYQQPFYKLNLTDLNEALNAGSAISYTKDEMKYSPKSFGVILTFNIGFDDL